MTTEQTLQNRLRHFSDLSDEYDESAIMKRAADRLDELEQSGDMKTELLCKWEARIQDLERQLAEAQKDQARLDFMIESDGFIVWELFDRTFKRCYMMTQDEDEEYHRISGDEKSFDTPRQAIDAAMSDKVKT